MKRVINLDNWNRKEHFKFFSALDDPFWGITTTVDFTSIYQQSKNMEEEVENLQSEVQVLRKTILTYKSKVNSLQSIIALMVNDFGIDQVALASGISVDKIKEYLQD